VRADSDGDGVPDDLDDCPTVSDPEQRNARGSGPGDACLSGDLAAATADMAVATDLAQPASPPDLAPGPSICSTAGVLFCEGFENTSLPGWGFLQNNGTVGADSVHVYRGSSALHAHQNAAAPGAGATGVVIATPTYPSTDIYLRAFVYLPGPAPAGIATFLRVQESMAAQYSLDLQISDGKLRSRASRSNTNALSNTSLPLDRWACVEWQIHLAASGFVKAWVDGLEVTGISGTQDTRATTVYDWLVVGLDTGSTAGSQPARELWLDEVALDNKPIGCAK